VAARESPAVKKWVWATPRLGIVEGLAARFVGRMLSRVGFIGIRPPDIWPCLNCARETDWGCAGTRPPTNVFESTAVIPSRTRALLKAASRFEP